MFLRDMSLKNALKDDQEFMHNIDFSQTKKRDQSSYEINLNPKKEMNLDS